MHHDLIHHTPRQKEKPDFLNLSYEELMVINLDFRKKSTKETVFAFLEKEKGLKAVTVAFSDLEGKLHMLDYNRDFFMDSHQNLTFDGSSIKGFTPQHKSDLRLSMDWSSFRILPGDIFGNGKVIIFGNILTQDGSPYEGDFRSNLSLLADELSAKGYSVNVAPEIEGFIFEGENAEQEFDERKGFELASKGGYFNVLPQDRLRQFIDRLAEATRAMGFENEKDHPEVAPSQFEMNYKYTDVLHACDQILIYKVIARQIAKTMGMTASFLPKPIVKINGSGMHTNISLSQNGKNIFYDKKGKYNLSEKAHDFATGILYHANDLCLAINSSVNAYRRLDPHYEAPNEIKMSSTDRGSMIRIPIGNEKSARIEVRTVAPDVNPYFAYYLIIQAGLKGMNASDKERKEYYTLYKKPVKKLPGSIQPAINMFKRSHFIKEVINEESRLKYIALKEAAASRCASELGTRVKTGEVWYHHEITNQILWNKF